MFAPIFHVRVPTHIAVDETDAPAPALATGKTGHAAFVCSAIFHFYAIHYAMKTQSADSTNLQLDNEIERILISL